ncbi:MAG: glycosyltransferase [Verrucomicrobia bacterium]|nr:glycosyltransferase [Verrucomicrobiota bacterium]MBU1736097.1 glycosyltransferase [Verrucomicrobiota bacterium]MBU1857061.1 glycosyltransferase [Verrucomicrobiota bacterium]
MKISVVIPVLNAAGTLPALLEALAEQHPSPPDEIVLVDSLSTDDTRRIALAQTNVRVVPLARFSHGRARNLGAREATSEIIVLMTQDALPADGHWLAELLEPLADPQVAAVYSRQVPRPDAPPTEKFFLAYHFPPGPPLRRVRLEGRALALADVFFSNVSAAVRREALLQHPFDEALIMSEDQQFARDLILAGYTIVYQPSSVVVHSHRYSLGTAFRRYFDSVYSLTLIFPAHDLKVSAAMGRRYLRQEICYMLRHHPLYVPYYCLYTLCKMAGVLCSHFADRMPLGLARACSLHRYYWEEKSEDERVPDKPL